MVWVTFRSAWITHSISWTIEAPLPPPRPGPWCARRSKSVRTPSRYPSKHRRTASISAWRARATLGFSSSLVYRSSCWKAWYGCATAPVPAEAYSATAADMAGSITPESVSFSFWLVRASVEPIRRPYSSFAAFHSGSWNLLTSSGLIWSNGWKASPARSAVSSCSERRRFISSCASRIDRISSSRPRNASSAAVSYAPPYTCAWFPPIHSSFVSSATI